MFLEWHASHSQASVRETVIWPQSPQYHTGIWWPHQSWREMHQSRTLFIQLRYVLAKRSGTNLISPSSTTRMASFARGCIFTNHWSLASGSTSLWQREHVPTLWTHGSMDTR